MALLADGLWISNINLSIDRADAPIPDEMKEKPIEIPLSQTQIRAIIAVLGLGLEDGSILCYSDDDLDKFMRDPSQSLISDKYRLMTAEEIHNRRKMMNVFEPIVKKKNVLDMWANEGFITDSQLDIYKTPFDTVNDDAQNKDQ